MIINDQGELLAFKLTPGNVDDRKPVPEMTQDIIGKLFGDRGYISQALFEQLYERGLKLITRRKKKMKQQLVKLIDKILLRKRSLIETVNDQLKNISRSRSLKTSKCLEFYGQSLCWTNCLYLFTEEAFSRFRAERITCFASCSFLISSNSRYSQLKQELAQKYPEDIEGYMDGKYEFVKRIERKAIQWQKLKSLPIT